MIIITGGFGMIGSNLVKGLNEQGHTDILVVDDLTEGTKFVNLVDCEIADYIDKSDFLEYIRNNHKPYQKADVIFHLGACSSTTEWNGHFMLKNNYEYSKELLHFCMSHGIPFIYASSAAVYGGNETFKEYPEYEKPLNVYGYSKLLFDQYVRRYLNQSKSQIVGLRYFNVYGPREQHKGSMASVAFHANQQINSHGVAKLFGEYDGYTAGEQQRDFVYVGDVANVNVWFYKERGPSGIYNVGTGEAATFNRLVNAVIQWHEKGNIEYVPFPEHLKTRYQSFTQADITYLRQAGYRQPFLTVEKGVSQYLDWLKEA